MAVFEQKETEPIPLAAGNVKNGNILVFDLAGKKEFVKVTDVSKVKTGKHGAAKVLVTGKELKTGNSRNYNFNGGQTIYLATMNKKQYVLVDVLEDSESLYMRVNDNSGAPADEYAFNLMSEEEVKKILDEYNKNDKKELVVHIMTSSGYVSVEDIRPYKE